MSSAIAELHANFTRLPIVQSKILSKIGPIQDNRTEIEKYRPKRTKSLETVLTDC